jgi:hypothetical protein
MKFHKLIFSYIIFQFLITNITSAKLKLRAGEKIKASNNDPYNINDITEIYYAQGKCTKNNCDNCINSTFCQCPYGYAQDPKKEVSNDVKSCKYKMKKQWVFFLLELLLPFGIGHFYAKRIIYGICKLCTFVFIILFDFIVKKSLNSYKAKFTFNIFMYVLYFGYIGWEISDIILIGINYFKDGKGIKFTTLKKTS